jgi:hypothetical protein
MSTAVASPQEQTPDFDAAKFIEARNKGEAIPKPEVKKEEPAAPAPEPERKADSSRSERRRLRAAEERTANTVLKVLKESGVITEKKAEPVAPAEPKRSDFPAGDEGMAQFLRATQKFDREQEAKTTETRTAEQDELRSRFVDLDAKTAADIEANFPDWQTLEKEWKENEEIQAIKFEDIPTIIGLLAASEFRAAVSYHWMKNVDDFLELCEMKPADQIKAFHRLEGRLEKVYDSKQKAAQAEPKPEKVEEKTASTPQKPQGRAEPQQEEKPAKPKPSSEVAARGGSPAPDEPAIGSPAWMLKRNQAQFGH